MRFTSISSGSEGNALIVESAAPSAAGICRVMIDCGLGLRDLTERLSYRGLGLSDLDAIFVTHEHGDHVGGVARLARAAEIPVFLTHGTRAACPDDFWRGVDCREVQSDAVFEIGSLTLSLFPVPHDAREPAQLVLSDDKHRLGVLTDVGKSTPHIQKMLSQTHALFLEANHDEELLAQSDYPLPLKTRIAGPFGHLSNKASSEILSELDQSRLEVVVAAHLSQHNNRPELVLKALEPAIYSDAKLQIASQAQGFDWIDLS